MPVRLDELLNTATQEPNKTPPAIHIRKDDLQQSQHVDATDLYSKDMQDFLDVTNEQIEAWKAQGPIGYAEQATRVDKTEMIPFWSGVEQIHKSVKLHNAVKRIRRDQQGSPVYSDAPDLKTQDQELLRSYMLRVFEEQVRGVTIPGRITQGVANLPAYMIEFIATGGLAALGRKGTTKAVQKTLGDLAKKKSVQVATRVTGEVAGAGLRTFGMFPRVGAQFTERRFQSNIALSEKGLVIADSPRERAATSFFKAFGDVMIENVSEVSGPGLARVGASIMPKRMVSGLTKLFQKLHPSRKVTELFTKAGYNGFIEELGEEQLGKLLRGITGVDTIGDDGSTMLDRIVTQFSDGEEFLVEMGVLAVPGAVRVSTSQIHNMIKRNKKESGKPSAKPSLSAEVSDDVINPIAEEIARKSLESAQIPDRVSEAIEGQKVAPEAPETAKEDVLETKATETQKQIDALRDRFEKNQLAQKGKIDRRLIKKARNIDVGQADKSRPILNFLRQRGGIQKDSNAAKELRALGLTSRNAPGLFKKEGKIKDFDAIPMSEFRQAFPDASIRQAGQNLDPNFLMEQKGRPTVAESAQQAALRSDAQALLDALKSRGIEISKATDQRIDEVFFGKRKTAQQLAKEKFTAEKRAIDQQFKSFRQGLNIGQALAKKEIKDIQSQVVNFLNASKLSRDEKAKFLATVKNIQTQRDLLKALPDIERRAVEGVERVERNKLKQKLLKRLKTTKPKGKSKPIGKFTPATQDVLDALRTISRMKAGEAQSELDSRLKSYEDGMVPSAIEAIENRMLAIMADAASVGPAEISRTLEMVEQIISEGKEGALLREFKKAQEIVELQERVEETVLDGESIEMTDQTAFRRKIKNSMNEFKGALSWMHNGWFDTLDIMLGSETQDEISPLSRELGFAPSRAFQEGKGITRKWSERFVAKAMEIYGFTSESQLKKMLMDSEKLVNLGTFENARGEKVLLQMRKSEMRKRWMELQDPTLIDTITSEQGNAYTAAMIETIEKELTNEDIAFAQAQLDLYRELYKDVNAVYSKTYGINLPFNEFYSPISREHDEKSSLDTFLQEQNLRRSASSAGALKTRVKTRLELKNKSDSLTFETHLVEMSHFISMVETGQKLNAVFQNGRIRKAIRFKYGKQMLKNIDSFLRSFATGSSADPTAYFNLIDRLRVNFQVSVLGAKPALMIKQLVSYFAYADFVTSKELVEGAVAFGMNPKKAIDALNTSELLKARGGTITRDLADLSRSQEFQTFLKHQNFKNQMLLFVRAGDRAPIIFGGYAVYRAARKKGKTHAQAIEAFERAASMTQQSSDLDQLSGLQRGGSFAKLFTMFMSAQNQYMRREFAAARNLMRGKIPFKLFVRKMAIYHFILPMMFQFVSDAFRFDPKKQIRAAVLGSLNGFFIMSDMIGGLIGAAIGEDDYWRSLGKEVPIFEFAREIGTGIITLAQSLDDLNMEDILDGIKDLLEGTGKAVGVPVEPWINELDGIVDLTEGKTREGVFKVLGWPPSSVQEPKVKRSSRRSTRSGR